MIKYLAIFFVSMLKESKEKLCNVVEDEQGEYALYGKKYKKVDK